MIYKKGSGFSIIEVMILSGVVVLLIGLGVVGWRAFNKSSQTSASTSGASHKTAEIITTKADLDAAEKSLNELDFSDESAAQAESKANL